MCPECISYSFLNWYHAASVQSADEPSTYSSSFSLFPNAYANPPPTIFAKQRPSVAPLTNPLAPHLLPNDCFLRPARTRYAALQADVMPALSALKPLTLRYELKSRMGGKSIGSVWKGRACWAKTRTPRRAGGTGFSVLRGLVVDWFGWVGWWTYLPSLWHIGERPAWPLLRVIFLALAS